jgi:hypothetical protein
MVGVVVANFLDNRAYPRLTKTKPSTCSWLNAMGVMLILFRRYNECG